MRLITHIQNACPFITLVILSFLSWVSLPGEVLLLNCQVKPIIQYKNEPPKLVHSMGIGDNQL